MPLASMAAAAHVEHERRGDSEVESAHPEQTVPTCHPFLNFVSE